MWMGLKKETFWKVLTMVSIWKWSASIVCLVLVKSEGVTALGVGGRSYISTYGRGTCSRTSETFTTRMHSSRMRNVRCSSRLPGGGVSAYPGGVCLPGGVWLPGDVCLGGRGRCLPRRVSICLGGVCLPRGVYTSLFVDRILDTRLWKYYLSATSFADGNKQSPLYLSFSFFCFHVNIFGWNEHPVTTNNEQISFHKTITKWPLTTNNSMHKQEGIPHLNKFEQISSLGHQMSVAGDLSQGAYTEERWGQGVPVWSDPMHYR